MVEPYFAANVTFGTFAPGPPYPKGVDPGFPPQLTRWQATVLKRRTLRSIPSDAAIATFLSEPPNAGAGTVYSNLTSLWARETAQQIWYFWAPHLLNSADAEIGLFEQARLVPTEKTCGRLETTAQITANPAPAVLVKTDCHGRAWFAL